MPEFGVTRRRRIKMTKTITGYRDMVALSLSRADDPEAYNAIIHSLRMGELPGLLLAATDLMSTLIKLTDRAVTEGQIPPELSVRVLLQTVRDAINEETAGSSPEDPGPETLH